MQILQLENNIMKEVKLPPQPSTVPFPRDSPVDAVPVLNSPTACHHFNNMHMDLILGLLFLSSLYVLPAMNYKEIRTFFSFNLFFFFSS